MSTSVVRRLSAAALVFIVWSGDARAQSVHTGIELQANHTRLVYESVPDAWDTGGRIFLAGRVFVDVPLTPFLSLQPAVRYARIGNRVGFTEFDGSDAEFRITQEYIGLPVLVEARPLRGAVFVSAGVDLAYLLTGTMDNENAGPDFEPDVTETMNRINVSALLGLGRDVRVDRHRLHIRAQYARGLTAVAAEQSDSGGWLYNWRTRELGVALGYRF